MIEFAEENLKGNGRRQSRKTNQTPIATTRYQPEPGPDVAAGRAFEMRVLGVPEEKPGQEKDPPEYYIQAENRAIKSQPTNWNPVAPPTAIAQDLFNVVHKRIKETHPNLLRLFTLKVYSTADTPLDTFGIDLLFRLEDQFGNSYASASLDLTINLRKMTKRVGANFLLFPFDLLPNRIEEVGKMICTQMAHCIMGRSRGFLGNKRPYYELLNS